MSPLIILGREIGQFKGWDQGDTMAFIYYDFRPATGFPIPACDLAVDYDAGYFSYSDDVSNSQGQWDIITVLGLVERN